jgi:hypothetical protein
MAFWASAGTTGAAAVIARNVRRDKGCLVIMAKQ